MTWPEPTAFLWGLFGITTLGTLLPLDVGRQRRDYIVLTIAATVVLPLLGPRGLLLIWGSVLVAFAVGRGGRWLLGTAAAITVGFSLAHPTYTWLLDREYPFAFRTGRDLVVGWLTLTVAWCGTMSVRFVLHRISHDHEQPDAGHDRFDAFDSPLVPYLLPTVAGAPILAASIALYREDNPWPALVMLLWCLPVYALCRFELHRQRLARELRRSAESRQRLAAIGEVTARIVHQSRHQAGLMGWSLHRLRRLVGDPSEEAVNAARHELDILAAAKQHIQETLDSELLHERRSAPADGVTVAATIEDVCAQLADKASRRGITVSTSVDADVGATAAPAALREALFNVVDNASDAAIALVRITVPARPPGSDGDVVVEVHDDGPGVPAHAADRLYEPFFSTKPDGTGMGLAIADALVADVGGHLTHTRTADTTTFALSFPPAARSGLLL